MKGEVHLSFRIRKNSHLGNFLTKPGDIGFVIRLFDPEEN